MDACFCDDVEESQNNKRERERERKKGKQKREKKADGNFARLKSHKKRAHEHEQVVKEFISVFEKFLHFFPSLRLM